MSKNSLSKPIPAWHSEAAEMLKTNFEKINQTFLDTTRKAVWLGIFLNYIKTRGKEDKSIPHGQFREWLDKNVPSISITQLKVYMALGRNVAEKAKFQIAGFRPFAHSGELPAPVENLVDGKTQNQLFLEFKQSEDDEEDGVKPKRGRRKGQGGLTKEQRVSAEAAAEQAHVEAIELKAEEFAEWLDENSDAKGLGQIVGTKAFTNLTTALEHAVDYIRRASKEAARK